MMNNIGQLMKQAKQMQEKMAEVQAQLATVELEGTAGGGMVTATMTGDGKMVKLKVDPSIVDASDVEMLEDLIVAACNDAKMKVDKHAAEEMSQVTGGMGIPGGLPSF